MRAVVIHHLEEPRVLFLRDVLHACGDENIIPCTGLVGGFIEDVCSFGFRCILPAGELVEQLLFGELAKVVALADF